MHDYRKLKVSVNGRIGSTARLSERLRRYVTSNPLTGNAAAGNGCNVADMASLLEAVRNAGANNVVVPTLASLLNGLSVGMSADAAS